MVFRNVIASLSFFIASCASTPTTETRGAACSIAQPPVYPAQAARDCVEGYVTLEFSVGSHGCAESIQVVESVPDGIFDRAAQQSLSTWKFDPSVEDLGRRRQQTIEFVFAPGACDSQNKTLNTHAGHAGVG